MWLGAGSQNLVNAKQKAYGNVDCQQSIPPRRVTTAGIQEMLYCAHPSIISILRV